jgi:hypothetical protein
MDSGVSNSSVLKRDKFCNQGVFKPDLGHCTFVSSDHFALQLAWFFFAKNLQLKGNDLKARKQ